MNSLTKYQRILDTYFSKTVNNEYILVLLALVFTFYGSLIAPNPPVYVKKFFASTSGKLVFITLLLMVSRVNFTLALGLAFVFLISVNSLAGRQMFESYASFVPFDRSKSNLIDNSATIAFGCEKMKISDIYKMITSNTWKTQKFVRYRLMELMNSFTAKMSPSQRLELIGREIGLDPGTPFTDEFAPYIATILVYWGFDFGNGCQVVKTSYPPERFLKSAPPRRL
jgi:hypothetical protein